MGNWWLFIAVCSVEVLLDSFNLAGCLFNDLALLLQMHEQLQVLSLKYEPPYGIWLMDIMSWDSLLIMILCIFNRTVYIHGFNKMDFTLWHSAITLAAGTDGKALSEQQLTKNGVPIIVDSCIAFVTQYGKFLENYEQKSFSKTSFVELLL